MNPGADDPSVASAKDALAGVIRAVTHEHRANLAYYQMVWLGKLLFKEFKVGKLSL